MTRWIEYRSASWFFIFRRVGGIGKRGAIVELRYDLEMSPEYVLNRGNPIAAFLPELRLLTQ
jgi:hypothetical protein